MNEIKTYYYVLGSYRENNRSEIHYEVLPCKFSEDVMKHYDKTRVFTREEDAKKKVDELNNI